MWGSMRFTGKGLMNRPGPARGESTTTYFRAASRVVFTPTRCIHSSDGSEVGTACGPLVPPSHGDDSLMEGCWGVCSAEETEVVVDEGGAWCGGAGSLLVVRSTHCPPAEPPVHRFGGAATDTTCAEQRSQGAHRPGGKRVRV